MTAKEKAQQLIDEMLKAVSNHDCYGSEYLVAKDTALVAVDEIRNIMKITQNYEGALCWKEIKKEIEKL